MSTNTIDWVARIDYVSSIDVAIEAADGEAFAGWLLDQTHGDAASYGPGSVTVRLTIDGDEHRAYSAAHVATIKRLPDPPLGWMLGGVDLQRADLLDAELAQPALPALVGITESAEILGVTRQRAHAIAHSAGFPPPVAQLAAGPVYLEHAVRAFAARPRRSGRPATGQLAG